MDEHNPYRASSAPLAGPLEKLDIESTSKVRRFFNWVIDELVAMGLGMVLGGLIALTGGEAAVAWLENMSKPMEWAMSAVIIIAYYTCMEGAFGFTVGKLITQTRVVDEYGRPPGFARALLRSLCRLIPFNALSLLISDDAVRRGWHDSLSRCYVVNRPRGGRPVGTSRRSVHAHFADGVVPAPPAQEPQSASAD
jgi:uncharacterized RDD family membrane protein YckC